MGAIVYYSVHPRIRSIIHRTLSHEAKRKIFQMLLPSEYNRLQRLRIADAEWSYKPLVEHRCIFVHIPKTGGISVANSLFGRHGAGHDSLWWYQLVFDHEEFDSYFKFAFVRNPWDRLVSAYTFLKQGGMSENDKKWAEQHLSGFDDFDSFVKVWVNRQNIYKGIHFVPQFEFVCLGDLRPAVDFIGRFERLAEDFNFIREKLGKESNLQKLNMGAKKDYRQFYTKETIQIVADAYYEDVKIFGYDFKNTGCQF